MKWETFTVMALDSNPRSQVLPSSPFQVFSCYLAEGSVLEVNLVLAWISENSSAGTEFPL